MEDVEFKEYVESDLEWVLKVMVESLSATLTPERLANADPAALMNDAKKDFDRFHYQAKKPEMAIVAWRNGARIGMVWITMDMPVHEDKNSAWLLEVYVVPELRRQGLAKVLLKTAEEWAKTQGASEMWLNVGGGNQKALSLYEGYGFHVETMHLCKKI
jgi:GNAT superfamily N-acetyltransferase